MAEKNSKPLEFNKLNYSYIKTVIGSTVHEKVNAEGKDGNNVPFSLHQERTYSEQDAEL